MLKPLLTIPHLMEAAKIFCASESARPNALLYGVTDGKAVGTLIEQAFQKYLHEQWRLQYGRIVNMQEPIEGITRIVNRLQG